MKNKLMLLCILSVVLIGGSLFFVFGKLGVPLSTGGMLIIEIVSFILDKSDSFFYIGMPILALVGLFRLKSEIRSKRRYELACEIISAYCIQAENIMKYVYIKDIHDKEEFFPIIRGSTEKLSDSVNKINLVFKKYCNAKGHADNLVSTGKYIETLFGERVNMLSKDKLVFAQSLISDELSYNDRLALLNKEKQKLIDALEKYM